VEDEVIIKPVLESFVEIFEGEVFQKIVRDIITGGALSNNTITCRIKSMGKDLREQIYEDFCFHLTQHWPLTSPLILRQKHSC